MMNIKEGLKRIYILVSVFWAFLWFSIGVSERDITAFFAGIFIPIIVYYIILWIVKGFKKK